jgi:hypothetical protein
MTGLSFTPQKQYAVRGSDCYQLRTLWSSPGMFGLALLNIMLSAVEDLARLGMFYTVTPENHSEAAIH